MQSNNSRSKYYYSLYLFHFLINDFVIFEIIEWYSLDVNPILKKDLIERSYDYCH